jgi:NADPH:quinone reductase
MPNMKAIVIDHFGGPEALVIKEVPRPDPKPGFVEIQVKAFGLNHAELHMRKGEWAEWMPISGIECVGIVSACPGGEFTVGTKVATMMGGLGRSINGSYAEYTCAQVSNVVPIETSLPWDQFGAIGETYVTAWTCLFRNLELKSGQRLLVRGATSALGQAAVNLAVNAGAIVTATTRKPDRFPQLEAMGVKKAEIEGPNLSERLTTADGEVLKFDAVLELVGNSTLLDSMKMVRRGGRLCLAGFLGGLAPIAEFNPLLQMASGVHFSFFGSFVFGTPEWPLSDVPLQEIVQHIEKGDWKASPSHIFAFEDIQKAHRLMEANEASGKVVVRVD